MTIERIRLNGDDWLMKDFVGEDWIWRNAEKPGTRDVRWWRKGRVPGSVLHDLWVNGEVPDPYVDRNSLLVEWVPERTWVYKKAFAVDPALQGKRLRLRFEGVDYEAQFFLNGKPLGRHAGMYVPVVFDVTDKLAYGGENLIAVVIEKAPDEQPQVSKTSYVRTHKSRMTYWWDFCPRMIHQGIWDDVTLEVSGPVCLTDVWVRPQLAADYGTAAVSVSAALDSTAHETVTVETVIYDAEGEEVSWFESRHAVPPGETRLNDCLRLEKPRLWQPNGSGEAYLYEAHVTVHTVRGELLSERRVKFGVRRVELERNDTPDETALPYMFVVNGRRTYINGWNWVPIDVMYGAPRPEKLERLLQLAKRAGVNMLRVWGGGLIEKSAFYELCDRYGIMVWQEFIQSSSGIANKPSEDPAFVAMMTAEAEAIVPRRRNHPSLVLWCGGNELQGPGDVPLNDAEPVLAALKDAVGRLHPDALWLATSPTGRLFSNSLENIENDPDGLHDVHGPWEHQGLTAQYELYNRGTSLLHSEFGVEGMTHWKTLQRTVSEQHRWPASRDNAVYFHRGAWWINEPLVQASYGGRFTPEALPDMIRGSQYLQAEGLRYAVESNRRRQWRNTGTLPWQFNEPYPNAYCTSALDYYAQNPKPVYFAVARAYRPMLVSASFHCQAWAGRERFEADVWVTRANPEAGAGAGRQVRSAWRIVGASGRTYGEGVWEGASPASSMKLHSMAFELRELEEDVFFLDLRLEEGGAPDAAVNRYAFTRTDTLEPMLDLPKTKLRAEKMDYEDGDWRLYVTNDGTTAAFQVQLDDGRDLGAEGYVYFEDSGFVLMPGETRPILANWSGVAEAERVLEVSAWNAAPSIIR